MFRDNVKVQLFCLDLRLDDPHEALHDFTQGNYFRIQGQPPALDLCHVQHIVDKPKKMAAGKLNFPKAVLHLGHVVQMCLCDGRHADDGIHRRPDIMAHVGEELALCTVGPLRLLHGAP